MTYKLVDDVLCVDDDRGVFHLTVAPEFGPGLTLVVECEVDPGGVVTAKRVIDAWDEEGCEEGGLLSMPAEVAKWIESSVDVLERLVSL